MTLQQASSSYCEHLWSRQILLIQNRSSSFISLINNFSDNIIVYPFTSNLDCLFVVKILWGVVSEKNTLMLACYFQNRSYCLLFYILIFSLLCAHSWFRLLSLMLWASLVPVILFMIKSSSRELQELIFAQLRCVSSESRLFLFSLTTWELHRTYCLCPAFNLFLTSHLGILLISENINMYLCLCSACIHWVSIVLTKYIT